MVSLIKSKTFVEIFMELYIGRSDIFQLLNSIDKPLLKRILYLSLINRTSEQTHGYVILVFKYVLQDNDSS